MKKWWILGAIILVILLILGSYIYVRVGYKKPIFAIEYKSNKVYNGERYDGIIFSTFYCKDGSKKVTSRFTDFTCSTNRNFVDGYYENEHGVKISKEVFDKYKLSDTFSDIDEITSDDYEKLMIFFDNYENGNSMSYSVYDGTSEEGFSLLMERDTQKLWCVFGHWKNGNFILGDYVDGKCIIPGEVVDYVKDEKAILNDIIKEKITCNINNNDEKH